MAANTAAATLPATANDIMASVDDNGTRKEFIIADISRDNSWLSIPLTEAAPLPNWQ
ncbi:DUF7556 family protein [Halococcus sediminicola]|uniref:DUF7556 family protein n=1 Tax=Halococcus sediminicola TaxID=1264579 RepID=UPI001929D66B|nr:hypothetical protein [Halococcus sediminicola]